MPVEDYPTIDYVRQCMREEDGHLFWLKRPLDHFPDERMWKSWNTKGAGKEAGYLSSHGGKEEKRKKRCTIRINRISLMRYWIVWALHKGEWRIFLDHKNRNQLDDRIDNLRPSTMSQNIANAKLASNNRSGFKGVSWNSQASRWQCHIYVNGKSKCLGFFDDAREAHAAYMEAARKYFGEFACDGVSDGGQS